MYTRHGLYQNQILTIAVRLCLFLVHVHTIQYIKENTYLYLASLDI